MGVSFSPDKMEDASLPSNFDGTIGECAFVAWKYPNADFYRCFVRWEVIPDDEDIDPRHEYISVGDLDTYIPSKDNENPVDLEGDVEDMEGPFLAPHESRDGISPNSNLGFWVNTAVQAGFPREKLGDDIRVFEGARCHFDRVDQPKRDFGDERDEKRRTLLVISQFHGFEKESKPKTKTKTKTKAKAKIKTKTKTKTKAKTKPKTSSSGGDLETQVENAILSLIAENDGAIEKKDAVPAIIGQFSGPEKAKAIRVLNSKDFLSGSESFKLEGGVFELRGDEEE